MISNILVFFGPPHSGKSSMAKLLVARKNFQNIDLGQILRKIVSSYPSHPRFEEVKHALTTGTLITDEATVEIVEDVCKSVDQDGIIFDGFPRSISAIKPFKIFLSRMGISSQLIILCQFTIDRCEAEYLIKCRGRKDDLDHDIYHNRISNFYHKTEPTLTELKKSYIHVVLPFSNGIENNYSKIVEVIDERNKII